MKKQPILFLLGLSLFSNPLAFADRKWNDANNPVNFEKTYLYDFNQLPSSGNITDTNRGWSDSYWPLTRGSIGDRWQVPELAFKFKEYILPSPHEIMTMSQSELNLLSPAEKFDIIRGRFDFPLMKYFQENLFPTPKDWWRGICHGWAHASLYFDEPKPILYQSPLSGISVPLASSDIKGLLAYYYGNFDITEYPEQDRKANKNIGYIGKTCRSLSKVLLNLNGACSRNDVNAGAFHVALTNELGILHRGFAMDRDQSIQVWNHPVVGYQSKILSTRLVDHKDNKEASKEAVKEITLESTVKLVNELYDTLDSSQENDYTVAPTVQALGNGNQHYLIVTYRYILELDSKDRIIGGEWLENSPAPDLLWKQPFDPKGLANDTKNYKEDWTILDDIIRKSTGDRNPSESKF
jgi:hypothetical protein